MNQKRSKTRFRFSVRTLLIFFALVAVCAGLIGRTLSGYFREVQVAKDLEEQGAEVLLALVPPKETIGQLLYRFGARKIFHRVINLEFRVDDQITNSMAQSIARLPNLLRLEIECPVSNRQLEKIAESPALQQLNLYQEGKLITANNVRTKANRIQEIERTLLIGATTNRDALNDSLKQLKKSLAMDESRLEKYRRSRGFTDEGILAFQNHPTLKRISVLGCNVSNGALRAVLESLDSEEDVEKILNQRTLDELTLCGAPIAGLTKSGKAIYGSFEDAERIQVQPRDSAADFSRLQYILPDLNWQLKLARHLPLDGKNKDGFRVARFLKELRPYRDQVRSIVAQRDNVELWDIVEACENVRQVTLSFELTRFTSGRHLEALSRCPHVEELNLDLGYVSDDDLLLILEMKNLKRLTLPNAVITTAGLQRLIDADLALDHITLPQTFRDFDATIQASDLAKEVEYRGNPNLFHGAIRNTNGPPASAIANSRMALPLQVATHLDNLMRHAEFPWPDGSPPRPEDEMLSLQRAGLLGYARLLESDPSVMKAVDQLLNSLKRTPQLDVPIKELMAKAPDLRVKYSQQHKGYPVKNLEDWHQIVEIYGVLAEIYQRNNEYEKALEMRVRQAAWAPMTLQELKTRPTDLQLAELCRLIPKSSTAHELKDYFFLFVADNKSKFELPNPHMAEWYLGKTEGVPVLAPLGRHLAVIESNNDELAVTTGRNPGPVTSQETNEGKHRVELPAGTNLAYVDPSHFPITVELADQSAVDQFFENPFALGKGKKENEEVPLDPDQSEPIPSLQEEDPLDELELDLPLGR